MLTAIDIGILAHKALMYEVSASPKPGLVDRFSSGIHTDMDFFTFIDSGAALVKYFSQTADIGMAFETISHGQIALDAMMNQLRPLGIKAEHDMYTATGGVNTHKGLIYAMGLMTAASGFCIVGNQEKTLSEMARKLTLYEFISCLSDDICAIVQQIVRPEMHQVIKVMHHSDTYGARQFKAYGMLGARGEAANGYESVRKTGLKALDDGLNKRGVPWNEAMLLTLVSLISVVEDSNVAGKHNKTTLDESRKIAVNILEAGFPTTVDGNIEYGAYIQWCLENRVSHGGAADLLAVTVFLWNFGEKIYTDMKKI